MVLRARLDLEIILNVERLRHAPSPKDLRTKVHALGDFNKS